MVGVIEGIKRADFDELITFAEEHERDECVRACGLHLRDLRKRHKPLASLPLREGRVTGFRQLVPISIWR
jgi:hypothetical protein